MAYPDRHNKNRHSTTVNPPLCLSDPYPYLLSPPVALKTLPGIRALPNSRRRSYSPGWGRPHAIRRSRGVPELFRSEGPASHFIEDRPPPNALRNTPKGSFYTSSAGVYRLLHRRPQQPQNIMDLTIKLVVSCEPLTFPPLRWMQMGSAKQVCLATNHITPHPLQEKIDPHLPRAMCLMDEIMGSSFSTHPASFHPAGLKISLRWGIGSLPQPDDF